MKIYFIGIGGIGVSALAQYYLQKGDKVFGSDAYASEMTEMLSKLGANIVIGPQKKENISANPAFASSSEAQYDLVIYSPAVKNDNPELMEAKGRGIKCLSYPEALGEMTKEKYTIAIAGTHGKSTTTAMVALILIKAGLDPTVVVGTKLKEFGNSNFRMGKSKYFVIEACEHEESFLNYRPQIAVITNIEGDHLDYYKTLENIKRAFNEFAGQVPEDGFVIKGRNAQIETKAKISNFSLEENKEDAQKIKAILKVPGDYNILNGLAALGVARLLNISDEVSLMALSQFYGSWRRFDTIDLPGFTLIDDYAHHPTEIGAMLASAREKYKDKKILCVFQPHQYQRTQFLWSDFINVFKKALAEKWVDDLILLDVYDVIGREGGDIAKNYNSKILAEKIGEKCIYLSDSTKLEEYFSGKEVVIMMGAGNIYNLSQEIKSKYLGACAD
ncbi:MAG: Mur ligase family protein [Candidatus Pacebacteria bacterium]|nr:Mur ligase family protein [Candidatus Paceibacterota bacterium]